MKALKLTLTTLGMSLLLIAAMLPIPFLANAALNTDLMDEIMDVSASDTEGVMPAVSTMVDATGKPMAWFYEQNRDEVASEEISKEMKDALVAIEDRRFYEHNGVDPRGVARALAANLSSGGVSQGSSTLEMQYVKNFNWLIAADSDEEREEATEQSIIRKLKEMRIAVDLNNHFTKDEILTNYLNLVTFGNGSYGVEVAARTYFGIHASDLNTTQSALLAGLVQAPYQHDPYTNPEGAMERRDAVLMSLRDTGKITPEEYKQYTNEPLGILPEPNTLPQGCIASGDRGFFCDYVLGELEDRNFPIDDLTRGGYLIKTSLDPALQDSAKNAVNGEANPQEPGAAQVMNFIRPGHDKHEILAMASSRDYGLNEELHQTTQPLTNSMVGAGAGSVAKVFTAASAMENGMNANESLPVPARYEASGMGTGGAAGCPPDKYCVENAGTYESEMSLEDALAQSPNTTFIMLQEKLGLPRVVDMAVRLGMRSYAMPGTAGDGSDMSLAQATIDGNRGSFTLGADAVNPLELANVSATLASDGMWCEPSAVTGVIDRVGVDVEMAAAPCEQAVDPRVANDLSQAMHKDVTHGTAKGAAVITGWNIPMAGKTGTSEGSGSAAFLGHTREIAGASYVFDDSPAPAPLCTAPLRSCAVGDVFGGMEPARGWMNAVRPYLQGW